MTNGAAFYGGPRDGAYDVILNDAEPFVIEFVDSVGYIYKYHRTKQVSKEVNGILTWFWQYSCVRNNDRK